MKRSLYTPHDNLIIISRVLHVEHICTEPLTPFRFLPVACISRRRMKRKQLAKQSHFALRVIMNLCTKEISNYRFSDMLIMSVVKVRQDA